MKITLAIPTYNRLSFIKRAAESLKQSTDISKINVRVYDDCSTEFSVDELKNLLPFAKEIIVRNKNLGADNNTRLMYEDFLKTEDDILVNGDSDLIYRPGWVEKIQELLPKTDGLLSIYNSNSHEFIDNNFEHGMGIKKDVGAAGCVLSRRLVEYIVSHTNQCTKNFDWVFPKLLQENNVRLFCTVESYVQHIGITRGSNQIGLMHAIDYGHHFLAGSEVNQKIISDLILELNATQKAETTFWVNFSERA
ncbi:hypothetical protein IX83_00225 [Basilea psittacipulmonis DSM 24701]|uniref:Glycosyltransferase 2-like domain-containing protein n=2 Tax=Basilea TaxID=1472344 RepID=A0A077DBC0_9BURK|nr:hypothetical protein IX83_00225 [Basilea psittacipulmonis DSM 24701]